MQKFFRILFSMFVLSAGFVEAADCDWPSVNRNHHQDRSSPCTTITYDDVINNRVVPQWSVAGGTIQAAPIVYDGVVYYGDTSGNLWAVNITNGAVLYHYVFPNAGESVDAPPTINPSTNTLYVTTVSAAASPPTAAGLRLYAFDLTFTPKPDFNGGLPVNVNPPYTGLQADILAGPVVVDNLVIVATCNADAEETATPIPTYRGGYFAFDANFGTSVWEFIVSPENSGFGTSGGSWSTPAVDTKLKLMFVGTTNATSPPASPLTDSLLAIDYTTGLLKWHYQYLKNDVYSFLYACGPDLDVGASPNLFKVDGCPVVGVGSKGGIYRVFHRKTGKQVWQGRMIPKDELPQASGNPSSAYANGTVYTVCNTDHSGIDFNPLSVVGQYAEGLGDYTPLLLSLNYLENYNITYIRALDGKTGKVKWTNTRISNTFASITEANGVLYTGNFRGEFRAIDANTGNDYVIYNFGTPIEAPITIVQNQIFIGLPTGLTVYYLP